MNDLAGLRVLEEMVHRGPMLGYSGYLPPDSRCIPVPPRKNF